MDYIIEESGKIIAQIAYSTNNLVVDGRKIADVVTLGPLCVHPDYQRMGYAKKLIEYTMEKAKDLGIPFIFVIGDEKFYEPFGFESASEYGIQYNDIQDETPFFMVKVFDEDKINSLHGIYIDNPCFNVDENELEEFDKKFPFKKKEKLDGQLDF
ncbi:MAG: hypothetical protein BZ138_01290 [Methanosphaera sp. rholeuAM270]|nr:MAG: hypothetical protein BZ138_01290 [Methanosphaera sp. rholeuAM270]